jgi:hypothetical protein
MSTTGALSKVTTKVARRIAAGAFLMAWGIVAWISWATPYLQSCTDEVARVGSTPLIRSCGPMSILDPPLLVLLVACGLLLLPDLKVIELFGIVRLERVVEEARKSQEELTKTVQDIKLDINLNVTQAAERAADTTQAVDGFSEKLASVDEINETTTIKTAGPGENDEEVQ